MSSSFCRASLAAACAVFALLALAQGASAATLSYSGTTLTFSGSGDASNQVTFTRLGAQEVRVVRSGDSDPITSAPGNPPCVENVPGVQYTCFPVSRVVANGNAGDDLLNGGGLADIPFTANGGAGTDSLSADEAADTLDGGADPDELEAGEGNDTLNGGDGDDSIDGESGDDTENGGEGKDLFVPGVGNDVKRGEGGDDQFVGEPGNDEYFGGPGIDTANGGIQGTPQDTSASLDDVANDRLGAFEPGEVDQVHADIEELQAEINFFTPLPPSGNDTYTGNAGANTLVGGRGNDTLDGLGGNDVLSGGDDNDTLRARDGFADLVSCGAGVDTAEVDTLDTLDGCETVNRADVGNANDVPEIPEDRPPTIALNGPASGALLRTTAPTVLTATATDDRGVAQVLFIDDERIVCADSAAPYTCDYRPRGEDVGRNTLVAVAVDTAQQTASTTRAFNVDRFNVASITGSVTPARDVRAPFVFRTAGRLRLPVGVTPALGCADGQVSIQVKAGAKTISTRRADLRRDCSFTSTVRFADRKRFTRNGRLRFTLRFTGNEVLNRSAAIARNIRTRS